MIDEKWIPIKDYVGQYEISNTGVSRSLDRFCINRWGTKKRINGIVLKHGKTKFGYVYVLLSKNGKCKKHFVHRLVANAFIPNAENLPQVNHIDGDKNNNCVSNLNWMSARQNCIHALENNLYKTACGEQKSTKLMDADIREIRKQAASGIWHKAIADRYGVGRKAISKIVNLQRWKHVI